MKLTKYEQSGFVLETESGFRLAFDIGAYTPVEKLLDMRIDAMLVSHLHRDHFSPEQIKAINPKKLYLNEECLDLWGGNKVEGQIEKVKVGDKIQVGEIEVEFFNVDHGTNIKVIPKENFGFLIKADGQTVYFAGDMFYQSGIDVTNLEVDYTLIPVGTFYTFGPQEAFDFAKKFKRIGKIITMHYEKTPETKQKFMELASGVFNAE